MPAMSVQYPHEELLKLLDTMNLMQRLAFIVQLRNEVKMALGGWHPRYSVTDESGKPCERFESVSVSQIPLLLAG